MLTQHTAHDGSRFYRKNNQSPVLWSVTTILDVIRKKRLEQWMVKTERDLAVRAAIGLIERQSGWTWLGFEPALREAIRHGETAAKIGRKAARAGDDLHSYVEWLMRQDLGERVGPEPTLDDDWRPSLERWQAWRKRVNLEPLYAERRVCSPEHGYAGTVDLEARVFGEQSVVDWKTGKEVYPEARLQAAAYANAVGARSAWIVRMPRKGADFEAAHMDAKELEDAFRVFLAAKDLFMWLRGR